MVSDKRAWHEADRADRLRYSQPARLCGDQAAGRGSESKPKPSGGPPSSPPEQPATLYSLLELERSASQAEIGRAYRRLLVAAHPDKGGDPEQFRQLKDAYAQLSDPTERLIYDEKLERMHGSSGGETAAGVAGAGPAGQAWCRRAGGVTAVVHGQTQGAPPQDPGVPQAAAACPAAAVGVGGRGGSELSGLQQATAAIQQLLAASASAAQLAQAHLRRAEAHRAAGQLHHALFDAEEALLLQPHLPQAAALLAALLQGRAGQPAPAAAAEDSDDELM